MDRPELGRQWPTSGRHLENPIFLCFRFGFLNVICLYLEVVNIEIFVRYRIDFIFDCCFNDFPETIPFLLFSLRPFVHLQPLVSFLTPTPAPTNRFCGIPFSMFV